MADKKSLSLILKRGFLIKINSIKLFFLFVIPTKTKIEFLRPEKINTLLSLCTKIKLDYVKKII